MATIGNIDNIEVAARDLMLLRDEALRVGRALHRIDKATKEYGLTESQINNEVAELDVASVQAAFDTAKATFLSVDVVELILPDPPEPDPEP